MSYSPLPYSQDIAERFAAEFRPNDTSAVEQYVAELAVEAAAVTIVTADAEEIERQRVVALGATLDADSAMEIRRWTAGFRREDTMSHNRLQFARNLLIQATTHP